MLDAALTVIRTKGYTATTIDDICAVAEVTKGSFFHHFKGKVELALAAIEYWNTSTGALFAQAPYRAIVDPRERLLAYIDFRADLLQGDVPGFTCLLGTLVQETFDTYPLLRDACQRGIDQHARVVAQDAAAAKDACVPDAGWDPLDLAYYTQAVLQGAFILAKAQGHADVARMCVAQLRHHVDCLLTNPVRPSP